MAAIGAAAQTHTTPTIPVPPSIFPTQTTSPVPTSENPNKPSSKTTSVSKQTRSMAKPAEEVEKTEEAERKVSDGVGQKGGEAEEVTADVNLKNEIVVAPEELRERGDEDEKEEEEDMTDDEGEWSTEGNDEESVAVDDVSGGTEALESEEATEILNWEAHGSQEEKGEVLNNEEKKTKKECKGIMRKSQVKVLEELEEAGRGTRRFSRRIAGQEASGKAGKEAEKKEATMVDISSEEEEEESPLKKRT